MERRRVISLCRATADDLDDYLRIERDAAHPLNIVATRPEQARGDIERYEALMIHVDGVAAGIIAVERRSSAHAYIAEVAVHSSVRGTGVGSIVLETVLSMLKDEGVDTVELFTHPQSPALRFYQRHGFRLTGQRIDRYKQTEQSRVVLQRVL